MSILKISRHIKLMINSPLKYQYENKELASNFYLVGVTKEILEYVKISQCEFLFSLFINLFLKLKYISKFIDNFKFYWLIKFSELYL